jgi:4-amino-4-deoxy-L-arabinose transferase-like glycosyltransferase
VNVQLSAGGVDPQARAVFGHRDLFRPGYDDEPIGLDACEQSADVQVVMALGPHPVAVIRNSPFVVPKLLRPLDGEPPHFRALSRGHLRQRAGSVVMGAGQEQPAVRLSRVVVLEEKEPDIGRMLLGFAAEPALPHRHGFGPPGIAGAVGDIRRRGGDREQEQQSGFHDTSFHYTWEVLSKSARFALIPAVYLLFFFNLSGVGMLGPDEPRYAAIGREMARSGDWITPRLWGEPWFEKPPLLYWMTGAAFRAGLGDDLAPRLPVALLSVAFLFLYWRVLDREFGRRAAFFAAGMLATSAAWLAFSHVGVTDLPLAATFSAAMLLAMRRRWTVAAALLGAAVLAKGLVPLVLALPLLWVGRKRWKDFLRPAPVLAFLAVAVPWYALAAARHGTVFLEDFFLKHHLERFATDALKHEQPFWFYVPVLAAGLFPWTPAIVLLFQRKLYSDARLRFLLLWLAFGFVFFSAATNKLPGYLLPLIPAACALAGIALDRAGPAKWVVAASAALLALVPVIAAVLPVALLRGLSRADMPDVPWLVLAPVAVIAMGAWVWERAGRRAAAFGLIACGMVGAVVWLEVTTYPVLDRTVSARGVWREIQSRSGDVCVGDVNRGWRYNLNYYSGSPLPACREQARPIRIELGPSGAAVIFPAPWGRT